MGPVIPEKWFLKSGKTPPMVKNALLIFFQSKVRFLTLKIFFTPRQNLIFIPYLYNKILILAPFLKISELIFGACFMFLGPFYFIKRNLCHKFSDYFKMLKQKYYYTSWGWGISFIFMMTHIYSPKIGLRLVKEI